MNLGHQDKWKTAALVELANKIESEKEMEFDDVIKLFHSYDKTIDEAHVTLSCISKESIFMK